METDTAEEKNGSCFCPAQRSIVVYKRSWRDISLGKPSDFHKERKRSKKKERFGRGRPVELPQPWKSAKDAFGGIFLMISTAAWKSLRGGPLRLSHSSTGPAAINNKQQNRTDHLLQKPDIFICYRQKNISPPTGHSTYPWPGFSLRWCNPGPL